VVQVLARVPVKEVVVAPAMCLAVGANMEIAGEMKEGRLKNNVLVMADDRMDHPENGITHNSKVETVRHNRIFRVAMKETFAEEDLVAAAVPGCPSNNSNNPVKMT
jgi:hypothetical protein